MSPKIKRLPEGSLHQLAEGEGFEPSLPRLEAKRFSRPPHSAALPPFRFRLTRKARRELCQKKTLSRALLIKDPQYSIRANPLELPRLSNTPKGVGFTGGEMGIRTPDTLLAYTRFPIVLLKPDSDISPASPCKTSFACAMIDYIPV